MHFKELFYTRYNYTFPPCSFLFVLFEKGGDVAVRVVDFEMFS